MKIKNTQVDYRRLRFSNLCSPEFSHVLYLLYWPVYGILFWYVERFYPVSHYTPMYCPLDDAIPFCEWFVIPYLFWFVFLAGMVAYTFFYNIEAFRKMMKYIIITYSVTILIYFLFPTCQQLRPEVFERDNLLTRIMAAFYDYDTNTNVCPSIHVIGSLAVMEAAVFTDAVKSRAWKAAYVVVAILICLSTVFLKQHSVLDVLAALPLCMIAHFISFPKGRDRKNGDKLCAL